MSFENFILHATGIDENNRRIGEALGMIQAAKQMVFSNPQYAAVLLEQAERILVPTSRNNASDEVLATADRIRVNYLMNSRRSGPGYRGNVDVGNSAHVPMHENADGSYSFGNPSQRGEKW